MVRVSRTRAWSRSLLDLLRPERGIEVLVCPPFPYLWETGRLLKDSDVRARRAVGVRGIAGRLHRRSIRLRCSRDVGCRYVIVGHSERRHIYGESDTLVARKFVAAQASGLIPVFCVGETLDERERGRTRRGRRARRSNAVLRVTGVAGVCEGRRRVRARLGDRHWPQRVTPEQAQDVHAMIRAQARRRSMV